MAQPRQPSSIAPERLSSTESSTFTSSASSPAPMQHDTTTTSAALASAARRTGSTPSPLHRSSEPGPRQPHQLQPQQQQPAGAGLRSPAAARPPLSAAQRAPQARRKATGDSSSSSDDDDAHRYNYQAGNDDAAAAAAAAAAGAPVMSSTAAAFAAAVAAATGDASTGTYVNTGAERWRQQRAEWLKTPVSAARLQELRLSNADLDDLWDDLPGFVVQGTLRKPVLLDELVDVLSELWEEAGLM
ncbi:hypothetical protein CAOG_07219 [Capsaspora owczarzaki ATCC 30864]|uniref:hypothetical protein n=1 Tax=Capsaspora owczarzaki (strain ATCC 30864) TaxID=595528 RepID=UPI0001FE2C2B|nr:hypothetical protein CAOG_07219 [Capsaspora owczarzaki ATCC 30864]|eukprot:XP_004343078.1 hypothetical protein CAOG_07219 [Capsaspora owczarzaki ATCC 30864]